MKSSKNNHGSWKALQLMNVHKGSKDFLTAFYKFFSSFYMKKIVIVIPTNLVTNSRLPFFVISEKIKTRIKFLASWCSGSDK